MYATIRTIGKADLHPDDPVVLSFDAQYGRVAAYGIGGESYGFLAEQQPTGCVDGKSVYEKIGARRLLTKATVIMDGTLILRFDSPLFEKPVRYEHIERCGYGLLVPAI